MKKYVEISFIAALSLLLLIWLAVSFYKAYQPKPQLIQGKSKPSNIA